MTTPSTQTLKRPALPDPWLKPGLLLGGLIPLAVTLTRAATGTLGANPVASALNQWGLLALVFLLASLAATPLKRVFGFTWALRVRRMLGLFAFFYASLHLLTYLFLDRLGEADAVLEDIVKRPFLTVGMFAFALLVPLAWTSTRKAQKRLGFKLWQRLHRLSYLAAASAVVHFVWREKKDIREPVLYGAVLVVLLLLRWPKAKNSRQRL